MSKSLSLHRLFLNPPGPSLIVVIILYLPSRIWQLLKAKTTLEMPTGWTLNNPVYLGIAQVAPLQGLWVPLPQCGLISKVRAYFSVSNSFIEEVMHTLLHAVDLPWLCKIVCHLDTAFKSQQTDDSTNCEPASSWLVCWCRAAQCTNQWKLEGSFGRSSPHVCIVSVNNKT